VHGHILLLLLRTSGVAKYRNNIIYLGIDLQAATIASAEQLASDQKLELGYDISPRTHPE